MPLPFSLGRKAGKEFQPKSIWTVAAIDLKI
jgi:hypothetical protein